MTGDEATTPTGADPDRDTDADAEAGEPPERGPGRLMAALGARRAAVRGGVVGLLVTGVVFGVFVVLPGATVRSPLYYGALAFVLATAVAGLTAAALLAYRAYRLSKELQ